MPVSLDIGIVQFDPVVGDVTGNRDRLATEYRAAAADGADIVVTPELSLLGYPPRDLLHRDDFRRAAREALAALAGLTHSGPPLVVGTATRVSEADTAPLANSAVVLRDGRREATYAKRLLPTYDVFDEHRYFEPGTAPLVVGVDGVDIGVTICEDAWHDVVVAGQRRHDADPLLETAEVGADLILTLAASPFSLDKPARRARRFERHADRTGCPVVFVNQAGAHDELIFDGHSLVAAGSGAVERFAGFEPKARVVSVGAPGEPVPPYDESRGTQTRAALSLGLRDYFRKTGFEQAVLGLSGGIDSSVAATLAADALGADSVYGVSLPSAVTSPQSVDDARALARNLGIEFDVVSVEESVEAVRSTLARNAAEPAGVALENLQARVRGDVLMTIANGRDALVLTPDNKSEGAVGYCTLYGDAVGALAPLGDCYKRLVYELAATFNDAPPADAPSSTPIPGSVIEKPPTAELREGQTDADELPPYDALDPVIEGYVEGNETRAALSERHDDAVVDRAVSRIVRSEFKRRQTPPPLRVTRKAFGRGWNYPVAARYDHGSGEQ